jgi:hypothetical protein
MSRYLQTSLTTDQFAALNKALKNNEECVLKVYDEDDQLVGRLIISLPDNPKQTNVNIKNDNDNNDITPAQLNRIQRFLSMKEVSPEQKSFLRRYLGATSGKRHLTKTGARKVIYATISKLRKQGIYLNKPSVCDCSSLFENDEAFGD